MLKGISLCLLMLLPAILLAQKIEPVNIDLKSLNLQRIETNQRGMVVLGSWAAANIVVGTAGYFIAKDDEWKAFHGMNAIWNVANGFIALAGYAGTQKERTANLSSVDMLHRYESTKRLYLINAGLDAVYIGTGVFLIERGKTQSDYKTWEGFGKSVAMQGVFLLFFDGVMYASHQSRDKHWYKLMEGICITGNGIGLKLNI